MFGYVRVNKPEMKVREYELYRSTYCGLCRSMGKCTGQCSRMTLSYDFAFLALTRISVLGEGFELDKGPCIAHPFHKRSYMRSNPTLEYCAAAAALLNYHKVRDDLTDERGAKKIRAVLLLPFVSAARRRAIKKFGLASLDGRISEGLRSLSEMEKEKLPSVDEPARIFGRILADITAYGIEGDRARVAYAFGMSVGKWIYIADALDDWREDAESGSYNPFILLYGNELPDEESVDGIRIALKNELCSAEGAFDLIDPENEDIKNIIANILFLGLPLRIEEITKRTPPKGKNK